MVRASTRTLANLTGCSEKHLNYTAGFIIR